MSLSLEVQDISGREKFQKILNREKIPLFWEGDSINGTLIINPNNDVLKPKGALISLVGIFHTSDNETPLNITQSDTIQVELPNKIEQKLSIDFTIPSIKPQNSSFYGHSYYFEYYIVAKLRRRIVSDLSFSLPITIIPKPKPISSQNDPWIINLPPDVLNLTITLDKSFYTPFDILNGEIFLNTTPSSKNKSISISIVMSEKFNNQSTEYPLCKYQILDETPPSGIKAPFLLQLDRMHLIPFTSHQSIPFQVNYNIDFIVKFPNNQNVYHEYSFPIYITP